MVSPQGEYSPEKKERTNKVLLSGMGISFFLKSLSSRVKTAPGGRVIKPPHKSIFPALKGDTQWKEIKVSLVGLLGVRDSFALLP